MKIHKYHYFSLNFCDVMIVLNVYELRNVSGAWMSHYVFYVKLWMIDDENVLNVLMQMILC